MQRKIDIFLAGIALFITLETRADLLDRVNDALSIRNSEKQFQLQLSGLIDFEGYFIDQRAPALIETDDSFLFNPRVSLFLDAQFEQHFYFFAQARLDRGFDPSDQGAQVRLDEYFLRYTPFQHSSISFQIGKFATVVGNWVSRHYSWDNPFINAPLLYENLTGLWDSAAPRDIDDYRELLLGQDISFAWHHWQFWAEFYETRFEVPRIGNADTFAYYLETKYKFTPQLFGALRWNQQLFGTVRDGNERAPWGNDIWRVDAAVGYRFTDYLQTKVQYSFSHQDAPVQQGEQLIAAQLTVKF